MRRILATALVSMLLALPAAHGQALQPKEDKGQDNAQDTAPNKDLDDILSGKKQMTPVLAPVEAEKPKPKPAPVTRAPLRGEASVTAKDGILQGSAEGSAEDKKFALYGEDSGNQMLELEWDYWRNRFLREAEQRVMAAAEKADSKLAKFGRMLGTPPTEDTPPRFPPGTEATFDCEVNNQGRITDLKIVKTSGSKEYDRAVFIGIQSMDGTDILKFPKKSQRTSVRQAAIMQASEPGGGFTPFSFGDIERLIDVSK